MGKYVLRNGIVVAVDRSVYDTAGIRTIKGFEDMWVDGSQHCLAWGERGKEDNPMTWTGGDFGSEYDIIAKYNPITAIWAYFKRQKHNK